MKIRNGFVSNSSSSSFCIIGTHYKTAELVKATKAKEDDMGYGMCNTKTLNFYGSSLEDCVAGLDAEPLLQTRTIPEAKKYFQKYVKDMLKVDIDLAHITFEAGEAGND